MRHLFWFRHDLPLHDNTGLTAACKAGEVVPCLILDVGQRLIRLDFFFHCKE
ncbi:MAG TPA: deoxyribodipyrimidine photo-lyase [Planctomycetota bacterium]|nr:deoxyribodipyrimidine photo-lyase [Planctomycetota bacterium]